MLSESKEGQEKATLGKGLGGAKNKKIYDKIFKNQQTPGRLTFEREIGYN